MPALRAWIRTQACAVTGCLNQPWGSEAAHFPRTKLHGDLNNLIPLCHKHHMEQHYWGVASFGARYGLDAETARAYTALWDAGRQG